MENKEHQLGFSLLEVLVAWFLLSMTITGTLMMQIQLIQRLSHQNERMNALIQIENLLDKLRANHSSDYRARELESWKIQNRYLIPKSDGNFICEDMICTATIKWLNEKNSPIYVTTIL